MIQAAIDVCVSCRYEDDNEEHLLWDELAMWLANADNKLKGEALLCNAPVARAPAMAAVATALQQLQLNICSQCSSAVACSCSSSCTDCMLQKGGHCVHWVQERGGWGLDSIVAVFSEQYECCD
jgi:hypothetical protein